MAELLNHQHCKNCERAVPVGETLCSDTCRSEWAALQKKRSRTVLFFYGAAAFVLLFLIMQLLGVYK